MSDPLSPYYGDEKVMQLQAARDRQVADLLDQPGAVVHGRVFSSDDPDALGWDRLRQVMAAEGVVVLRGVDAATEARGRRALEEFEPTLHRWDLFMADAARLREVCGPIAEAPLPAGLTRTPDAAITPELLHEVQVFLTGQGVIPFSTAALGGELFPARMVVIQHPDGRVAATGFAAMTHNAHSPFAGMAWVGLIAVDPELRGTGLGKHVDALCNLAAVDALGATATMEFVAPDNVPSRAMLKSCGLRHVADRTVVMFSTSPERLSR